MEADPEVIRKILIAQHTNQSIEDVDLTAEHHKQIGEVSIRLTPKMLDAQVSLVQAIGEQLQQKAAQ